MSEVRQRQLLPIGEVAKRTYLTVKALRHYHEIGLLVPSAVDRWTGYRGYAPADVERARLIARLRSVELPLAEMPAILDDPESEAARACLEAHACRLRQRRRELYALLARVDNLIEGRSEMTLPPSLTEPTYRDAEPRSTATITVTAALEDLPRVIPEVLGELYAGLREGAVDPEGPPFARYVEDPQSGDPFRIELGVPVGQSDGLPGRIEPGVLPGGRQVVVEHHGGYDRLGEIWGSFYSWLQEQDVRLTGAPYEAYLVSPADAADPASYVTEVVFYTEA